jgi:hypothetical protein
MNKQLFLVIFVTIVILLCSVEALSNKNKFRLKLVFDGLINKVILLLITIVVLMESYQLGVLLILGFFVIYTGLQINNTQVVEGFHNYFENKA